MSPKTRRSVLAALAGAIATAGCLTDPRGGAGDTTTTGGATTTGNWIDRASNSPDPDHAISVENRADVDWTVRVQVLREATDETVYGATHDVPSGEEIEVYNLEQADPDGVEAFGICGELVDGPTSPTSPTATDSTTVPPTDAGTTTTADPTAEGQSTDAASSTRECVTIETSECYADAAVTVREDETLAIIYAIC